MRVLIVGSGAGGATVAKELAARDAEVVLLERGPGVTEKEATYCYATVRSEVEILRTCCLGGSTLVSAGNCVRALESELRALGLDLRAEFEEIEHELRIRPLPDSHLGAGTKRLMAAATELGFRVTRMPKCIDPARCTPCGNCAFGCPHNAKWTALEFLVQARQNGAKIVTDTPVIDLVVRNGAIAGVRTRNRIYEANIVVLAAGALETPRLLQRTGMPISPHLFVDTFTTIGGVLKGIGQNSEVPMNASIECSEFVLYPHVSNRLVRALRGNGITVASEDILGMMVKIPDDAVGAVADEITKRVTTHDAALLAEGASIARTILERAGADASTFVSTPLRGAHPGGTARIGDVVDKELATEIEGLYVADASVLPAAPGAPPMVTIIALAKYLARNLLRSSFIP
ncbi:MAG TPA: GMC family oxidoreductase [Methanomicrobia archaeon]|nr:GMC family oxidoreductase [Methanomicrobia archaeon]